MKRTFLILLIFLSIKTLAKVTVSGVSSGALMALQFSIARSDLVFGAALIAGGPYACSQGNAYVATNTCMKASEDINTEFLVNQVLQGEALGLVAPLSGLDNSRFLILHGLKDQTVSPIASDKTSDQLSQLAQRKNIHLDIRNERHKNMAHAWPTLNFGNLCDQQSLPWLNSCQMDIGHKILGHLLQRKLNSSKMKPDNLKRVRFRLPNGSYLNEFSFVYTPESCRNHDCDVHLALHGCRMSDEFVGETFVRNSGLNEWAEGSGVIVVYPQVKKSLMNPKGCWDWFGYTGVDFAVKTGVQIRALSEVVEQLKSIRRSNK